MESKSIKNCFQNKLAKQLLLISVFGGLQGTQEPPKSAQKLPRPPRTPNIDATWGQLEANLGRKRGPKSFKTESNFVKIQGRLPKSAQDAPRPPPDPSKKGSKNVHFKW